MVFASTGVIDRGECDGSICKATNLPHVIIYDRTQLGERNVNFLMQPSIFSG